MAHTVTSGVTVFTYGYNGTWTDTGGGSGSATDTDYGIHPSGSRTRAVSGGAASRGMHADIGSGNELNFQTGQANEDELVYFGIQCYTPGLIDNLSTAPGLRIRMSENAAGPTNHFAEWDIAFSNLLAVTNLPSTEFFRIYAIDPRSPPSRTTGTWDYNSVRWFGAVLDTNATAKGQNLGIGLIGHGLGETIITGTSDTDASGFQEAIDALWNTDTARDGTIIQKGSTAFCSGKFVVGDDAGTLATSFTSQDTKLEWVETYYYDGTRIRSAIGYDDSQNYTGRKSDGTTYFGIEFRGNGTGNTDVTLGAAVGSTQGRSGPTITGAPITPTSVICDDGAVEDVAIYGTTFDGINYIDSSSNASTDVFRGNTFKNCGPHEIGPTEGRNNNYISGLGANYTFLETFQNIEAGAAGAALSNGGPHNRMD